MRNRLLKILQLRPHDVAADDLVALVEETISAGDQDRRIRRTTDALHSALFDYLPLPTQQMLLERWVDRGTIGGMLLWLKSTKRNAAFFNDEIVLAYWQSSGDSRAAKALAYQAKPATLEQTLTDIARFCDEGWIVGKAALRAAHIGDAAWQIIRERHPATYLYLCALTGAEVTSAEAIEIVESFAEWDVSGGRGLAIWAVGQMGMVSVLDRISRSAGLWSEPPTEIVGGRA